MSEALFSCPHCTATFGVPNTGLTQEVVCPGCGQAVTIPAAPVPPPASPPATRPPAIRPPVTRLTPPPAPVRPPPPPTAMVPPLAAPPAPPASPVPQVEPLPVPTLAPRDLPRRDAATNPPAFRGAMPSDLLPPGVAPSGHRPVRGSTLEPAAQPSRTEVSVFARSVGDGESPVKCDAGEAALADQPMPGVAMPGATDQASGVAQGGNAATPRVIAEEQPNDGAARPGVPDAQEPARELTRSERAALQFRRNIVLCVVCALALLAALWILLALGPL